GGRPAGVPPGRGAPRDRHVAAGRRDAQRRARHPDRLVPLPRDARRARGARRLLGQVLLRPRLRRLREARRRQGQRAPALDARRRRLHRRRRQRPGDADARDRTLAAARPDRLRAALRAPAAGGRGRRGLLPAVFRRPGAPVIPQVPHLLSLLILLPVAGALVVALTRREAATLQKLVGLGVTF